MKQKLFLILMALTGAAWFMLGTPDVFAQSIGLNIAKGGATGLNNNSQSDSLAATDLAGVVPQTHWNNMGKSGTLNPATVLDSDGNSVSLGLAWDCSANDPTGTSSLGTPDGKLNDGYIYTWGPGAPTTLGNSVANSANNNKPLVYVSGLNAWYTGHGASGYKVIVYTSGQKYSERGLYFIQSVSGSPFDNTMVGGEDLATRYWALDDRNFAGTYVQATGTSSDTATAGANYALFTGLTDDAILIRCNLPSGGYGAGINAFQIVPVYPSLPTISGLTNQTVVSGNSVTLSATVDGTPAPTMQWYYATGAGAISNAIDGATESTLTLNDVQYSQDGYVYYLCANNAAGTATSSMTLAVTANKVTPSVTVTVGRYVYSGATQGPDSYTTSPAGDTGSATWTYQGAGSTSYDPSATPPTEVGAYSATVSLASDDNFNEASSSATAFSIEPATPTVTVMVRSYIYDGSAQGPDSYTTSLAGDTGSATWSYQGTGSTSYGPSAMPPTEAGSYTATVSLASADNFNAASSSATAFTIVTIGTATPGSIGFNFTKSSEPDSLEPGDLAGAYAQMNWNNLGTSGLMNPGTLLDSDGNSVSLGLNWDAGGSDTTSTASFGTADGKLMDGFIFSWGPGAASDLGNSVYSSSMNNKPLIYVNGLKAWFAGKGASGYHVVIYTTGYPNSETGAYWVQSVSGSPFDNSMSGGSDLSPHYYVLDNSSYPGGYIQATGTSVDTATAGANFALITGLTNDAVLIRCNMPAEGYGSGINGFQLVPIYPSQGVILTNTVSGTDLTLSWPGTGVLQTSTDLLGPWTPIDSSSPVTVPINSTEAARFYRVKVK